MELPRFIRGRSVPESAQPHLQRRPASRSTRWNKLMLLLIWAALLSISMVPLPANQLAPEEGQVKLEAHHNTSLLAAIRAAELHLDAQILLLNPGLASHHQLGLDVTCFIGSYAATNKDPDQDGTSSSGNNYTIHFINMNQEWAVAPARKAPHAP